MIHSGQCHCGKLKATFETEKPPQELGVRTCQCDFCRRHGAVNTSDSQGEVVIEAAPEDLIRYRFGLRTADFLICRHCGVYIAAVIGDGEMIRSTINVAGLGLAEFRSVEEAPVVYDSETNETRVARRFSRWTPTRFANSELNSSYFGPHQ